MGEQTCTTPRSCTTWPRKKLAVGAPSSLDRRAKPPRTPFPPVTENSLLPMTTARLTGGTAAAAHPPPVDNWWPVDLAASCIKRRVAIHLISLILIHLISSITLREMVIFLFLLALHPECAAKSQLWPSSMNAKFLT